MHAESESRTAAQWRQLLLGAVRDMKFIGCPLPEASSDELVLEALMKDALPKARSALIRQGFTSQQIASMSRYEAVAVAESRVLGGVSDDVFKWSFLPVSESARFVKHQMETLDPLMAGEPLPIGHTLLPALYATRMAEMRSASTWAALMLVEAVRMHAAQHGSLPRELSEITVVPTFENPATGGPFAYVLETDANGPVAKITSSVDLMGLGPRKTRLEVRIERN